MLKALVIINTRLIYSLASKMLVFQTRFANALRNIKLIETNEKDYYSTTLILPGNQNVVGASRSLVYASEQDACPMLCPPDTLR